MAEAKKYTLNIEGFDFDFEIKTTIDSMTFSSKFCFTIKLINNLGLEYMASEDYGGDTKKRIYYAIENNKVKLELKHKKPYDAISAYFIYGTDCDKELVIEIELINKKHNTIEILKNQEINLLNKKYEELKKENNVLKEKLKEKDINNLEK
jgi:hypothetical protein